MYLGDTKVTKSFIFWKQIWCFVTQVTEKCRALVASQNVCVLSIHKIHLLGVSDQ